MFAKDERVYLSPGLRCVRRRKAYLPLSTHLDPSPYPSIRELTVSYALQFSCRFGLGQDRRDESLGWPLPNTFAGTKLLLCLLAL
jgi:hypothetical protein